MTSEADVILAWEDVVQRILEPGFGTGVTQTVRLRILDTLMAAILGLHLAESRPLLQLPESTSEDRIRCLVAAIRATEIDDIYLPGCATIGSVVVPTALVLAETLPLDAVAVNDSIAAGYEVMANFSAMIDGAAVLYRGCWPTLAAAPVAAAAVAARLFGLDRTATLSALAMAASRTHWCASRQVPRWLQLGHAAVDGVLAARAAAAGFKASPGAISDWAQSARLALHPERMAAGLLPRIAEIDSKTFPTSRQGLAAVQAYIELHHESPVAANDPVEVVVPDAYLGMIKNKQPPFDRLASLLSVPYQLALVASAPEALYYVARVNPPLTEAMTLRLSHTTIRSDPDFDLSYPAHWGARVTVGAGTVAARSRTVLNPIGSGRQPLAWSDLCRKAANLAIPNGLPIDWAGPLQKAILEAATCEDILRCICH
jgi:2-methylcitrate dehydratase PrpD